MSTLSTTLLILGIIAVSLSIIAILYITVAARRKTIVMKKVDYLVEDITYKSEMLNSTVETVSKVSNYVDIFEVVARKNMKSAAKIVARNKDDIYKVANRIKRAATGEKSTAKKSTAKKSTTKAKKKGGK